MEVCERTMEYQIADIRTALSQANSRMQKALELMETIEGAEKILSSKEPRKGNTNQDIDTDALETFARAIQEFADVISSSTMWSSVAHGHVQTIITRLLSLSEPEREKKNPTLGGEFMPEIHTHE